MRVVTSPGMFTESSPLPPSLLVPGKLMTWLGTVMGFEEKRGLPGQCDTPCQRIPGVDPVLEQSKVPSTRPNRPVYLKYSVICTVPLALHYNRY